MGALLNSFRTVIVLRLQLSVPQPVITTFAFGAPDSVPTFSIACTTSSYPCTTSPAENSHVKNLYEQFERFPTENNVGTIQPAEVGCRNEEL